MHHNRRVSWSVEEVLIFLLALAAIVIAGAACASVAVPLDATRIEPSILAICERHDAYVKADAELSEEARGDFLLESMLLRAVVSEAMKSGASSEVGK